MSFVHLHNHSHYSLLDGLSKIDQIIDKAVASNMKAVALTDHGVMYGAIEFYNLAIDKGIKPIVGLEAYIAPRLMSDREGKIDSDYHHLTILCKDYTGYLNLMQLVTISSTEGMYYKPRLDLETLSKYSEGLIALSGCMRGAVARAVSKSHTHGKEVLQKYQNIFGKDNFYIEIQRNFNTENRIREENILNDKLIALAKDTGTKLVATSDCHYIDKDDAEAQDVLVCIGTQKTVKDINRLDMREASLHFRTEEEMLKLFSDLPEAVHESGNIADKVDLTIPMNQRYFPKVTLPEGYTDETFLEKEVYEKAPLLYEVIDEKVKSRIDYELSIIKITGFSPYFLMVADIVNGAKSLGAVTNTRGSAAGSIVGYILGITSVDPFEFELPFERFLTRHRPTPPDIDLDISDSKRDETIAWITEKYGKEKVAQIITFGTMQARAVVRDVGRALAVSYSKCDRLAKLIPIGKQGFNMTLEKAIAMSSELAEVLSMDSEASKIFSLAKKLEGGVRHASIHAAGIIITPEAMVNYSPLQKEPGGERMITQYDMYALDTNASSKAIGAIKMDLLGIRNLTILEEAVKLVKFRHNIDIDLLKINKTDKKTFDLLAAGYTFGVFQLGSDGMTRYLKELKATSIFDLMAMIALYRPGPLQFIPDFIARKHNANLITYLDPSLEKILKRTYGILVYQDDLLTIVHDLAGYTFEEADKFRKAIGKKIPEEMAKQKEKFIKGCVDTVNWSQEKAEKIWTWIEPFAAYGFNKSHSASYSAIAYLTAYMKANYTVEFMAALMTAESGNEEKITEAIEECLSLNINVLPPDINESYENFTVINENTIRFGLNAIKNLGSDVIDMTIASRKEKGKFIDLQDFVLRTFSRNFNKKSWEALACTGCLDTFAERGMLLANTENVLTFAREITKEETSVSLFGSSLATARLKLKPSPPALKEEKLVWEKTLLGVYISGHPLDKYDKVLQNFTELRKVLSMPEGSTVQASGMIITLKKTFTKKNDPMAILSVKDKTATIEVVAFPKTAQKYGELLNEDNVVSIIGKLQIRDDTATIIAEEIHLLPSDEYYESKVSEQELMHTINIQLKPSVSKDTLLEIQTILLTHKGKSRVNITLGDEKISTNITSALSTDLEQTLSNIEDIIRVEAVKI